MNSQDNDKIKENSSVSYTEEEADDFSVIEKRYSQPEESPKSEKTEEHLPEAKHVPSVKKEKKVNGLLKKSCICLLVALALIAAAFSAYAFTLPSDKIANGLNINGIAVGGMTKSEAEQLLEKENVLANHSIVLRSGNVSRRISTAEINAVLDKDATIEKAFEYAKTSNPYANAIDTLSAVFTGKSITPVISYDYDLLSQIVNSIGEEALGGTLVQHSVRFADDGTAYLVPGKSGYDGNPANAIEQIDSALKNSAAKEITLKIEKKDPDPMTVEKLDSLMYQLPENASYALENGQVVIIPEKVGRYINKEECAQLIAAFPSGDTQVAIPYQASKPEITADILRQKLFNAQLSSYTTRFNAGSVNRSMNIANAASKLNGKIILPGDIFSFNSTVGHRTVANGFKTAPEYQNGQTVNGIGGGTCQVSTTVYSAALYADLKIIRRQNHSMPVSYVPLGQDATVTDGGLDLKFENNTGYPIRLNASVSGGSITVSFTGTAPDTPKKVKLVHTPVAVATGKAIKSERQIFDASGNLIKSESLGTSRYKPHESSSSAAPANPSGDNAANSKPAAAVKQPNAGTPTQSTQEKQPTEKPAEKPAEKPKAEHSEPSASGGQSSTPVKTE